ncbi:MAG: ATPase, T2SS/T4P/T4SS family [Planctomycetota bacterium]
MATTELFAQTIDHYLAPIRPYLADSSVTEVMVNAPDEIYVERDGQLVLTDARFADHEVYEAAVNNILQFTGKSLADEDTLVDARLPDGSRVHVAKSPCARHGTVMNIRKFSTMMLDIDWLIQLGSLTTQARDYLKVAVAAEQNILVAGGTSSGKTSLLNAMSTFIPSGERIVVIEDSAELQLQKEHLVSLESKPPDAFGRGAIGVRDLFRSSLRLRPDRIIIGEVRGGEALDMIQAMTSGHGGSMGTLHANTPADALNRLETMALMSKVELPLHALRSQVSSAIDLVVQMSRQIGGRRLVTHISEVLPLGDQSYYQLRDIFTMKQIDDDDGGKATWLSWTEQPSVLAGRLTPDQQALASAEAMPIFDLD